MDSKEDLIIGYKSGDFFLSNSVEDVETHEQDLQRYFNLIKKLISSISNSNHKMFRMSSEDRNRLKFLLSTIEMLMIHLGGQHVSIRTMEIYQNFLKIISERLYEIYNILLAIEKCEMYFTENFDIFEMKMRGYYQEINTFFPLEFQSDSLPLASSIIEDERARELWIKHFGENCYMTTFGEFLKMISEEQICKIELENSSNEEEDQCLRFKLFLKYFLNFPSDDMVTPFKWNQLIRLFGPFDGFCENFLSNVTSRGFLGLINRIKAYEILSSLNSKRKLIVRLSRTEPQYLAFSYCNSNGHIGHLINKDSNGNIIKFDDFKKSKFPNYTVVDMTINVKKILDYHNLENSLTEYASRDYSDYLTSS